MLVLTQFYFVHIAAHNSVHSATNLGSHSQPSSYLDIALEVEPDVNTIDEWGRSPIYIAIFRENLPEINALLNAGAILDEKSLERVEFLRNIPQDKKMIEIISLVDKRLASQKSRLGRH
jgi:hypothetical protein